MQRKSLKAALAGGLLATALVLTGCSGTADDSGEAVTKVDAVEAVELVEEGEHTVIDVRTAPEYVAGHVEGAENIDVTAPDFAEQVEQLPKDEEYVVYCQSGNRSADAAATMADLGFTDVVDGGGIIDLAPAGAEIVAGN